MTLRERFLAELQMITGIYSNDLEYLCSLVIKDYSSVEELQESRPKYIESESKVDLSVTLDVDEWFNSLGGDEVINGN